MINLFLAEKDGSFEDLYKSDLNKGPNMVRPPAGARAPNMGGPGPKQPRLGMQQPKMGGPRPAKVPGAASGASGVPTIDCPLGAACPDGGKHQMGSTRLREHQEQSAAKVQTGQTPGDESEGKPSGKPGVEPGSQNMGSVGSDQVERTPPPVGNTTQEVQEADIHTELDEDADGPVPGKKDDEYSAQEFEQDPHGAKTRSVMQGSVHDEPGSKSPPPLPRKDRVKEVGGAVPYVHKIRTGMDKQDVPNPLDPTTAPPDSKPADHYKLAQVARDSGDEELAKQHEDIARKRAENLSSDEHKDLAEQLRKDGMEDHAAYHDGIHSKVQDYQRESAHPENPNAPAEAPDEDGKKEHYWARQRRKEKETGVASPQQGVGGFDPGGGETKEAYEARKQKVKERFEREQAEKKAKHDESHQEGVIDAHVDGKTKASKDLEAAKAKHQETVAKMKAIKDGNQKKQSEYEKAQAEYEKKKAAGEKAKPPKKPKLDKEEEVPEKPELYEPENDAEKLQHETHTQRAKRVADNIASHIKDNPSLSPEDKARLERAHRMAVYHANIGYTPTAAHKKELGEIERAAGDHAKENHADVKAREDQQTTQRAQKQADAERKQQEKAKAQQAKAEAQKAKEDAKAQGEMPKMPQSDLDHARMQDHKAKAQKIRANLESAAADPNISPEEKEKHKRILAELDKHENLEHVPGSDHQAELKEIEKLAGERGKKAFSPETATEEDSDGGTTPRPYDSGGSTVLAMLNAGRGLGQGMAASATSPYGAAGHLGSQIVNYGVTGAVTAGHRLLHDAESASKRADTAQAQFDTEKERQEKQATAASQVQDGEKAKVMGRGNT